MGGRGAKGRGGEHNSFPNKKSQIKHIFRDKEGHITDTPINRSLIKNVANKKENYLGKDKYGNSWYSKIQKDGTQVWSSARKGKIINGGVNKTPMEFDFQTGLNKNPNKK